MNKFNYYATIFFASIGFAATMLALYYFGMVICTDPPYNKTMTWLTSHVAMFVVALASLNIGVLIFKNSLRKKFFLE